MLIQVALPQEFDGYGPQIMQQLAVNGYHPMKVLGQGNFGMLVIVGSPRGGIEAAKVFLAEGPNKADLERTARHEMRLARELFGMPHVVGAIEVWETPPLFFLISPYIHGQDLEERISGRGAHGATEIAELGDQIAEGLIGLHRVHVIHRDLNPGNIRVTPEGYIYLIDFNISKDQQGTLQGFSKVGTEPFCPLEQYSGVTNEWTDQYGWGMTLAAMARGTTNLPNAKERRKGIPLAIRASNPAIPVALEEVIERAAALHPQNRFHDMVAARTALHAALQPAARSVPVTKPAPAPAVAVVPAAPPQLPPLPMKKNICAICGYKHQATPAYCDHCGAAMDPAVAALVRPAPVIVAGLPKGAAVAPTQGQVQAQHQAGQPPLLIDPVAQIATVIFGGALHLGGSTLSTFGQLLVIAHYVSIIIMLFLEVGFGLVAHSGDPRDLARAMLFMTGALAWFCVRTVRPGAFTRRDYMQRWARRVCLVLVEAFCVGIDYFLGQTILGQDWGPLHLAVRILLGVAGLLLNYTALELWLN